MHLSELPIRTGKVLNLAHYQNFKESLKRDSDLTPEILI